MNNGVPRRGLIAWAFYDWANNAFSTVILTFVFSAYFTREIIGDEVEGSALWGSTIGLSGFLVALLGPVLGAATDQTGRRKPWIGGFVALNVIATACLWFVTPNEQARWLGALLVGISAFAIELSIVFYNAMLPDLAGSARTGRWSGWGWGLGYAGGLACLLAVLLFFVGDALRLPFLTTESSAHVRASFVFVAVWVAVFSLPLFLLTPDTPATGKDLLPGIRDGLRQLRRSIGQVREYADIVRFLIARIFYIDGLATMFAFGGVYAAGTFDMDTEAVLRFAIALNVTAGAGAIVFSWIDDRIGSRNTILIALGGLIAAGTVMLAATSEPLFWAAGLVLGVFVGPAQSASRSWLARAAPPELSNQMFGLFAFSGKATAFVGPLLVGWLAGLSGSQRIGMSVVIVFFAVGFGLLLRVSEPRRK